MDFDAVNRCGDQSPLRKPPRWLTPVCACLLVWTTTISAQDDTRSRSRPREISGSLPLPSRTGQADAEPAKSKSISSSSSLLSTTISLGLIVGTLLLVGRWMKRSGFRGAPSLPLEAFEVLGRRILEPKMSVHLVKCGSRVLLLGVGEGGIRTLSEIDDPAEVEQLTAACQSSPKLEKPITDSDRNAAAGPPTGSSTVAQRAFMALIAIGLGLSSVSTLQAQNTRPGSGGNRVREQADNVPGSRSRNVTPAAAEQPTPTTFDPQLLMSPQQLGVSLKMLALMTVFSLAPSILMMTTCFVRFTVVLGLLRQALGTQQGPPNQVLTAICLFLTFLVMSPVWQRCYHEGIRPYTNPAAGEQSIDEATALVRTIAPVRTFMSQQIDKAGNADAVWMLLDFQQSAEESTVSDSGSQPQSYDDVPFTVLAPAYLLSELKVGFLIGFQLFLPFLVIDLIVAMLLTSLGLTMLPPSMVSLPFKLLLFVLIDGWFLTIGMLLESVKLV